MVRDLGRKVKEMGISLTELARETGYSKSTISRVLRGDYPSEEAVRAVEEAIRRRNGHAVRKREFTTEGQRILRAVLEDTYEYRDFAVVGGESGIGKTHVLKAFAAERPDVLYLKIRVRMPYVGILNAMLNLIGARLGGSGDQKLARLQRELRERGIRMIVVDEGDLLVSRTRYREAFRNKVEIFRELWDDGEGVAVALVGLPVLVQEVEGLSDTYVLSRIGHLLVLPSPTPAEMKMFWEWMTGQDMDEAAARAVNLALRRGGFRMLQKIHIRAQKIGVDGAMALMSRRA